ncbi:MAG: ATP-binding cassette domain-containing protein, partial [Candidatus Dormibacteraeota bacterium]|nr:ATP-binding cassette domain-containing protein [Candidatus Dormibacteraeota bacterium]
LQGFVIAGVLAGVGGSVYAFGISRISFDTFHTATSINLVATAVIGGLGMLGGPLLGAFYIFGVPTFLRLDSAGLAAQAAGWLLLILYLPSGLSALVRPIRDHGARVLARGAGITEAMEEEPTSSTSVELVPAKEWTELEVHGDADAAAGQLLVATDLRKRYGGVAAVDGVTLSVAAGQTLGLIGPNGAGKTTLFEILSGFTRPDEGSVIYNGIQLNGAGLLGGVGPRRSMTPERRGRLGLVRSFQDAALFPTMNVEEVVMLSMERRQPTTLFASLAGSRELEGPKRRQARELIAMMGLDSHRLKPISALSTGTRRVAELCCMIALQPRLLLLDEPSSGIAQRETEALGQLLVRVREHLAATLVIIEHDIPMIMSLADRVVAMESGRIIADGTPAEVRANELVIESYLGGDVTAIERSDVTRKPRRKGAPALA